MPGIAGMQLGEFDRKNQFQHSARILTQALARAGCMIPMSRLCRPQWNARKRWCCKKRIAKQDGGSELSLEEIPVLRPAGRQSATQLRLHGLHKWQCQSEQFRISAPMTVRLKRILQNKFFCRRVCLILVPCRQELLPDEVVTAARSPPARSDAGC